MVTVGFGDISPVNTKEKIFIIIMVLFSCMNFGYVVNTIGQIFSEKAAKDN
jgi:hypothetical protein